MKVLIVDNKEREVFENVDRIIFYRDESYIYEGDEMHKVKTETIVQVEQ